LCLAALGAGLLATVGGRDAGAAVPTFAGQTATITGSGTIHGARGADVIVGSVGDDVIDGRGGNDLFCGGFGNDAIHGNAGDDTIYRNDPGGDDFLTEDVDTVRGDAGDDDLEAYCSLNKDVDGGSGADAIQGYGTMKGGSDDDR
jgi:Ca2+-binding RTX toxin-like protein